ncbi:ABC transporter ATP-binding protein [Halomonas caseinilytica]|uniref:Iron complex transport system ATP-binding protein n=1 Tax=Halomonas caseinilytica TaxID=438744 RepID=A0A1M6Y7R4_9GAMM|nr:ABC transporter ATP-binding protein [Halomonas caseinilytica]SHL14223.1 iron complex transport system ATP-binding protein [Halomonas caseinilytica]
MASLETRGLIVDVPGRSPGRALDLCMAPGECWGVLGPNGAGKTTLLHTLAGLRAPRAGLVRLEGRDLPRWRRREVAQRLGVVFQERHDEFPATVMETALIGRHPYLSPWQREGETDIAHAREALRRLDLEHLAPRLVSTLSGGERQRVSLATVLAQSPLWWLVDEPTNHLDLHHQMATMTLLEAQARAGCGVVMCLHDLNLAARWCSHLLLLYSDGEACWGPAPDMLEVEALERLYGQKLMCVEADGAPVFIPTR